MCVCVRACLCVFVCMFVCVCLCCVCVCLCDHTAYLVERHSHESGSGRSPGFLTPQAVCVQG